MNMPLNRSLPAPVVGVPQPEHQLAARHVALINWTTPDENAVALSEELKALGHTTTFFGVDQAIPPDADLVFTFAPYGRLSPILRRLEAVPPARRPQFVHWNFESIPPVNVPWSLLRQAGGLRAWLDRLGDADIPWLKPFTQTGLYLRANRKFHKARYVGDYYYAHKQGFLTYLCDASQIFAQMFSRHGLPVHYVPWGVAPAWYADLGLERDIDVLWMGKWRNRRRAALLQALRTELVRRGLKVHIADNVENPFIYGPERTRYLNRAKITLSILPSWYDPGFQFRFGKAAANRSLVVSTPTLPHVPDLHAGTHYVSVPAEALADTIFRYVEHECERRQMVENAYRLITEKFLLARSIKTILDALAAQDMERG